MFSPEDAQNFLALLLRSQDFLRHYRMSYSQGVWYIIQNSPYFLPPPPGIPPQNLMLPLDYTVCTTQGTVVPQRRWTPADEIDVRRYVTSATLQLPIYFVNRSGGVGFWLPDILQGRDHDLYYGDSEAPLGGRATTHLRINVSSYTCAGCKDSQPYSSTPTPSQWPGCGYWKRQIPTRDETHARNPITRARFMKHVATSVDKFLDVSSSLPPLSPPLIRSSSSPLAMFEGRLWGGRQLANRYTRYYARTREDHRCRSCVCW
jgi:hypothetical protein